MPKLVGASQDFGLLIDLEVSYVRDLDFILTTNVVQ